MARTPDQVNKPSRLRDYLTKGRQYAAGKTQSVADKLKGATVRGAAQTVGGAAGRAAAGAVNVGEAGAGAAASAGAGLGEGARQGYQQGRPPPFANTSAGSAAPPPGATPSPSSGPPVAPGKEGVKSRFQSLRDFARPRGLPARALTGFAKGAAKFAVRAIPAAAAVSGGLSALRSYNTPTDVYANRYGKRAGESFGSDLALRARGVGEDLVNALNPFSSDTFGTGADRGKPAPTLSELVSGDRSGGNTPLGAPTAAPRDLRGREVRLGGGQTVVQDAPNSFTNIPADQVAEDIGKPGGGLSIVGSLSPERVEAISKANSDLQEAREAASLGISTERYQRIKQNKQLRTQAEALGLRGNAAAADLVTKGNLVGNASLKDLLGLANFQQKGAYQQAQLGLRGEQLGVSQQQANEQQINQERLASARYIDQLNNKDPGIASAARGQLLQAAIADPTSAEGRLLFSQGAQTLRQRSGEERGLIDAGVSLVQGAPQFPVDLTSEGFNIENNVFGQEIVKDASGQVLGNLSDLPPEYAEAIRQVITKRGAK